MKTNTIEDVKKSDCGCNQCLWCSIECNNAEKFIPKWSKAFNQASCKNYMYYD